MQQSNSIQILNFLFEIKADFSDSGKEKKKRKLYVETFQIFHVAFWFVLIDT